SVGGTGKTQIIKALGAFYMKQGRKIMIISKGYGGSYKNHALVSANSDVREAGDEPLELAHDLAAYGDPNIIVCRNPANILPLIEDINPDLILVDDGLQNPSFIKDFRILMVDGQRGFGNGFIIPAGPLRESEKYSTGNADLIVCINPSKKIEGILSNNQQFIKAASEIHLNIEKREKILAFCGIGNPDIFFETVKDRCTISEKITFPDHHLYSKQDIERINFLAKKAGVSKIVTTEKDITKIQKELFDFEVHVCKLFISEESVNLIANKIHEKLF
ncbi:MAG: tetraacyldisaccharide 4'-kinase, partial [Rickettsiaceae bacterium]|nr:tetraacyldisaccharide 4'-kinase [Rickettsiaceae bacterium]